MALDAYLIWNICVGGVVLPNRHMRHHLATSDVPAYDVSMVTGSVNVIGRWQGPALRPPLASFLCKSLLLTKYPPPLRTYCGLLTGEDPAGQPRHRVQGSAGAARGRRLLRGESNECGFPRAFKKGVGGEAGMGGSLSSVNKCMSWALAYCYRRSFVASDFMFHVLLV